MTYVMIFFGGIYTTTRQSVFIIKSHENGCFYSDNNTLLYVMMT